MKATARLLMEFTTPDPPAVSTVILDENFDGGHDGDQIDEISTVATSHVGSGSFTISDDYSVSGGFSGKISGVDQDYVTYTVNPDGAAIPDHADRYQRAYMLWTQLGGDTAWFAGVEDDTGVLALSIGLTDDGRLVVDDGVGAPVTSAVTTAGSWYLLELRLHEGATVLNVLTTAGVAVLTVNAPQAAGLYQFGRLGLLDDIVGGSSAGNLWVEGWDGATSGAPTTSTVSGVQIFGSGSLTHSTTHIDAGVANMRINGTTPHYIRRVLPAGPKREFLYPYYHGTTPSSDGIICALYDSSGGIAAQLMVHQDGKLRIRDKNNGTGGAQDNSTATFSAGQYYFKISATTTGLSVDWLNSGGTLIENLTCTLSLGASSSPSFGNVHVGLTTAITGGTGINGWMGTVQVDDTQMPGSTGAGAPVTMYLDAVKADTAAMPERLILQQTAGWTADLVPVAGKCAVGASTPATGANGSTIQGLQTYMAFAGVRPAYVTFYKTGPAWNGRPTVNEIAQAEPAGQARAIIIYHWKIDQSLTHRQIANGLADAAIDAVAAGLKSYPHPVLLTFYHEGDDDKAPSHLTTQEKTDYRDMFRHAVDRVRAQWGPDTTRIPRFVFNVTGFSTWDVDIDDMYPGDDHVNVVAFDPYTHTGDTDFADMVDRFYQVAQAAWPSKPLMLFECGIDFTDFSDSAAAAILGTWAEQAEVDYPAIRGILYWNANATSGDYQLNTHSLSKTAWAAVVASSYFTVDTSTAP